MNKPELICYIAGRSGGHILPALTLIKRHKASRPDDKIILFSSNTDLDAKIRQESSFITEHVIIDLENVPQKKTHFPRFMWHVLRIFKQSLIYFRINKPHKVVSMGGYISIPVILAAYVLRIPIEIYELNVVPGKANMFLARFATTIFICFGASSTYFRRSCSFVSYPLRFHPETRSILQGSMVQELNLSSSKKTILILGGSQGSIFINNLIRHWVLKNPTIAATVQIIHQTGNYDPFNWKEFYTSYGIESIIFDYSTSIEHYYLAADLILARAGAGTLFEIQFFGKQSIIIPLQTKTTQHQVENAQAMALQYPYLFNIFDQTQCEKDPTIIFNKINDILSQLQTIQQMYFAQNSQATTRIGTESRK